MRNGVDRRSWQSVAGVLLGLLAVPAVHAQVTHTASAANTLTFTAWQLTETIPAGTVLSPATYQVAMVSGLTATGYYRTETNGVTLRYSIDEDSMNASTGPNETLWVIQSPTQVSGTLLVDGSLTTPFGTPTLIGAASIDVGDDGTVEWDLNSGAPLQLPLTFTGPLTIRVLTETDSIGSITNLAVGLEFLVDAAQVSYGSGCGAPLTLASNAPVLGANWLLTTSNIDAISPVAVTFVGDRGPAVPYTLLGLAAPGCFAHLSSIVGSVSAVNSQGTSAASVAVPNVAALIGFRLSAQSVCLTTANAAGLHSSNGVEATFGG